MSFHRSLGLVALVAAFGLPAVAAAQSAPAPAPAVGTPARHGHHHGWMSRVRRLDLTPDQRSRIKGLVADARAKSRNADPATKRQIHHELRTQIEDVLTPQQRAELRASAPNDAPAR